MTSKFSIDNRELLQRISSGEAVVGIDFGNLIVRELAAFRLAAIDSEPFAYIIQDKYERERGVEGHLSRSHVSKYISQDDINEHEITCTPLYRHAQPATVVPTFEEWLELRGNKPLGWVKDAMRESYDACRAAMLAAAQHDTPALNSVQSVVTVPGKWIPVSERMPENDGAYLCWDNRYVTTYAFIFGAWQANQFIAKNITHWMPLPAGPQEVR